MKRIALGGLLVLSTLLASCDDGTQNLYRENRATRDNQARLTNDIPLPKLETSLERRNLTERLERINQQNISGCIYLVSHGAVMAFYPVRGKVTSLNAYLSATHDSVGLELPDFDGAYGENADGIFFFTADTNAYVEWQGEYLWSDQCLRLNQQPLMVRQVSNND